MSDAELGAAWRLWMLGGAAVVLVVAFLLVAIWLTARAILAHAERALAAAERIRSHTLAIWELETTNQTAEGVLAAVRALEAKGARLVSALESPAGAGGKA